jgi:hypothetical protein
MAPTITNDDKYATKDEKHAWIFATTRQIFNA